MGANRGSGSGRAPRTSGSSATRAVRRSNRAGTHPLEGARPYVSKLPGIGRTGGPVWRRRSNSCARNCELDTKQDSALERRVVWEGLVLITQIWTYEVL